MSKEPPAPAIRLARFRVDHPVIGVGPAFHNKSLIDCSQPDPQLEGWSVLIRGAAVFFASPRGWKQGLSIRELNGKGPVTMIEVPRQHVSFVWECDDPSIVDKLQRFDSPPMAREAVASAPSAVIDSKDMGDP